jgi:hypothetical protein
MFGRSKRTEAESLALIREEMAAAELRSRAVLADALAKMELRLSRDLEQRRRLQTLTESAVETLQNSFGNSTSEVAKALGQVANMCAVVAERLDADRLERRAFTEALSRASRPPAGARADGPSKIIGGTFFAMSETEPSDDELTVIDANGATIDLSGKDDLSTNGAYRQEAGEPRA